MLDFMHDGLVDRNLDWNRFFDWYGHVFYHLKWYRLLDFHRNYFFDRRRYLLLDGFNYLFFHLKKKQKAVFSKRNDKGSTDFIAKMIKKIIIALPGMVQASELLEEQDKAAGPFPPLAAVC